MPANLEVGLRRTTLPMGPLQPRRLLDIIQRLPATEGGNSMRWLEGVTWEPFTCGPTLLAIDEATCSTDPPDLDAAYVDALGAVQTCAAWKSQTPFQIIDGFNASTLDYTAGEVGDRLIAMYNREISAAFARELLSGNGSSDRSLSNEAVAPAELAFGAAVPLKRALSALESHLALTLQGVVGYLHVPPGLLAEAVLTYGLRLVDGHWETPAGNIVISDAGYAEPPNPGGGAVADGEDWIYSSGPIFYESTAPVNLTAFEGGTGGANDTTPWNRNRFTEWLVGYGILVFDDCGVSAALASYTT